jgi:small-conductance mechanosensitive channel
VLAATTLETFTIGLVGASVPVSLGAWFVRRRTKAETADLITQASARVVEMLEARIADLEKRLATEQSERAALNLRLLSAEERERSALQRIAVLQGEVDQLRLRVARYENPITPKEENP